MVVGFIGLGRMGGSMVHRINRDSDHQTVTFDFSAEAVEQSESHGATGAEYGLMQAYAEGFELMHKSELDLLAGLRNQFGGHVLEAVEAVE